MNTDGIRKILVVDDENSFGQVLAKLLQRKNYESVNTTDPFHALEMLDETEFDLAISDIGMPGMDGLTLLRELRAKHSGTEVIIMTGITGRHGYSDIIKAGAADFVHKPIDMSELLAKIERLERERRTIRELREVNIALQVVLDRRDKDRAQLGAEISANVKELIAPVLDKLKSTRIDEQQRTYLSILETALMNVTSPFLDRMSRVHSSLSHMELQVAHFIKEGRRNKEIADVLGISVNTVATHRHHLRTKLGLKQDKSNLRSYLRSIDF